MSEEKITLKPKKLCEHCRSKLIHKSKFKKSDPWMSLEIMTTMVLISKAMSDKKFLIKYGNDVEGINKIDCLGCFVPEILNSVIETAKSKDLNKVQAMIQK